MLGEFFFEADFALGEFFETLHTRSELIIDHPSYLRWRWRVAGYCRRS